MVTRPTVHHLGVQVSSNAVDKSPKEVVQQLGLQIANQSSLDQMKSAGILIRDRSHEIDGCVRVTIGTIDQVKLFITEMEKAI